MSDVAAAPNAAEIENWNNQVGKTWAQLHERLDRDIRPFGEAAMARAALGPADQVLEIGCGCGECSVDLARTVSEGEVLAVDVSSMLLEVARDLGRRLPNLRFEQGDAQVHPFPRGAFDAVFSRFGVMFFEDPTAAFANIRTALKPAGRLAFCCWRGAEENEWMSTPVRAAAHLLPPMPPPDPHAPGPMAFADRGRLHRILQNAGFADIAIEPLDRLMGSDPVEDAVDQALRMGPLGATLRRMEAPDELKRQVEDALRETLSRHVVDGIVKLPGAVWIVSARNPKRSALARWASLSGLRTM
jgi:ubiquinone/menaquinone biosynthesis C-methylase UbiE